MVDQSKGRTPLELRQDANAPRCYDNIFEAFPGDWPVDGTPTSEEKLVDILRSVGQECWEGYLEAKRHG